MDNYFAKNPSEAERFLKVLEGVIEGKVDLNSLLRGKMTSVLLRRRGGAPEPRIHFDDEFSARCTILEILAQDAFGLLYRIGTVLSSHGCNIEVALITTEGHRAIDVFYITQGGAKLLPATENQIEAELLQILADT